MKRFLFFALLSVALGAGMVSCSSDDEANLISGTYDQDFSRWNQIGFSDWLIDTVFVSSRDYGLKITYKSVLYTNDLSCYFQVLEHSLDDGKYLESRVIFIGLETTHCLRSAESDTLTGTLLGFNHIGLPDNYGVKFEFATPGGKLITDEGLKKKIQKSPCEYLVDYYAAGCPTDRASWDYYAYWFQPWISQQFKDMCKGIDAEYGDRLICRDLAYYPGYNDIVGEIGGFPIRVRYHWFDEDMELRSSSFYVVISESGDVTKYSFSEMYNKLCDVTGKYSFIFEIIEYRNDYEANAENSFFNIFNNVTGDYLLGL